MTVQMAISEIWPNPANTRKHSAKQILQKWQTLSRRPAIHAETGLSFNEIAADQRTHRNKVTIKEKTMARKSRLTGKGRRKRAGRPVVLDTDDYRVGPGRPPKEYQFKPGQSGNPEGAKRKPPSIVPDLKALLERALNAKVKLPRGERDKFLTNAAAGMEQLADQFAKGDPRARRDRIPICEKLGVDLTNRKALEGALEDALSAEDEALLADFVKRHGGQYPLGAEHGTRQAKDANLGTSPIENAKLLAPPSENLIDSQIRQV